MDLQSILWGVVGLVSGVLAMIPMFQSKVKEFKTFRKEIGDVLDDIEASIDPAGDGGAQVTQAEWNLAVKDAKEALTAGKALITFKKKTT